MVFVTAQEAAAMIGEPGFPGGWEFTEVKRNGEIAGFFCVKGNEIHAYRKPAYSGRWLTRIAIEQITKPLIERFGFVTTSVRNDNREGHEFVRRLGFQQTHVDGLTYYKAERLKHARY